MNLKTRNALAAAGLALSLALSALAAPVRAAGDDPSQEAIDNALLSTVKIWILNPSNKVLGGCSGTVIDPGGYILTNFHCVGTPEGNYSNTSGKPGSLYHPEGLVLVGLTLNPRKAPKPTYVAKAVAGSPKLDIAVLKIVAPAEKGAKLPDPLPLVVIQRSDSEEVKLGSFIGVLGYPGIGGDLVNYSSGKVSGFEDFDDDGELDAFKTDATVAGGNSGGLAINTAGQQIGIPSYGQTKDGNAIGRVRMINLAEPYIQKALQLDGVDDTKPRQGNREAPVEPTDGVGFSNLRFGTDYADGRLANEGTTLPAGTRKIVAAVQVTDLAAGDEYGNVWYADGKPTAGKQSGKEWDGDGDGEYTFSLNNGTQAIPEGKYRLEFFVGGRLTTAGDVIVGKVKTKEQAAPPKQAASTVTLQGSVIDADTQRPIESAYVIVLKPGVSFDDIEAANGDDVKTLVAALGVTDDTGAFITAPGLARGKTYSVMIAADGYTERRFEDAVTLKSDTSNVLKFDPIELVAE